MRLLLQESSINGSLAISFGTTVDLPFEDLRFSAAVCFTMLHHVPSADLQDRLLGEVHRALRPGAVFAGSDSTATVLFRLAHLRDAMVLVDPDTFAACLEAAGFADVSVDVGHRAFRFRGRRPERGRAHRAIERFLRVNGDLDGRACVPCSSTTLLSYIEDETVTASVSGLESRVLPWTHLALRFRPQPRGQPPESVRIRR